jgi:hypothetical protein
MSEHFVLDANQLGALRAYYAGLRILDVSVAVYSLRTTCCSMGFDTDNVWIKVSGPEELLLRHRFLLPEWRAVPKSGTRSHETEGFGRGTVTRTKSGFRVDARYDDAFDKLAPVFIGPVLDRFRRRPPEHAQ